MHAGIIVIALRSIPMGRVSDFVLGSYVLSSKPKTKSDAAHPMITGESYRLREKRKSGLIRSRLTNVGPEQTHAETEVKIKKEPDGAVNNR